MSLPTSRVAATRQTRVNVARAAAVLFTERGYGGTTLQAIADQAGVSVETVGLLGPKRRLLREAFDMVFAGDGNAFPAGNEPSYIQLAKDHDLATAVSEYVRLLAFSIARSAGLWRALQAAADADPASADLFSEVRAIRRHEYHQTAQWLVAQKLATPDRVPFLVEQFYVIASHETFLLLKDECDYTAEAFADRLHGQVRSLLPAAASD